jgi:hypothetical protein
MSADDNSSTTENTKSTLPFFLDPGTKGGAVFLATAAFIIPIIGYNIAVEGFGLDGIEAGKWIGVGFTVVSCLGWVGTYVFRVATKDMTYVRIHYIVSLAHLLVASTNEQTNSLSFWHSSNTSNKYPTQAKQLKDYENAVIAKRMEELDDDELQALVEEVERDDF